MVSVVPVYNERYNDGSMADTDTKSLITNDLCVSWS